MTLWSILSQEAYDLLQRNGRLTYLDEWTEDEYWAERFHWMGEQLRKRAGEPPQGVRYPLWAWYQWLDEGKRRPDLRRSSMFMEKGRVGYRVEFEIDPSQVILSCYSAWGMALNRWHIPWNEADDNDFTRRCDESGCCCSDYDTLTPELKEEVCQSWLRVFDENLTDEYVSYPTDKKPIQACYWSLGQDQVRKVDRFIAR